MQRGRGAAGQPAKRPFGRGMGGTGGGRDTGPPSKWMRMDESGLFYLFYVICLYLFLVLF